MNISPGIIEAEDVERFSADLARRVADLLKEDVFAIDADAAQMIRDNYPGGYQWTMHLGGGINPVTAEFRVDRQGRVSIQLSMASGYRFWDATLQPRV